MLYGYCSRNSHLTEQTLGILGWEGVVTIQISPRIVVIYNNQWWTLHDNGGEINVEKINFPDTLRSVPYTSNKIRIDTYTMTYRILQALKGQEIDYAFSANFGDLIVPDK